MSYLATLFTEPTSAENTHHLTDRRLVGVEAKGDEPSYLLCLSRTLADELIVENRSWLGRTIEVLSQGLLFETDCPLHAGDSLRLEMAVDTRLVEGSGDVLHVQVRPDGLWTVLFEFREVSDESRELLRAMTAQR